MSHRSLATWLLLLSLGIVGMQACGSGEDAATTEEDPATTEEVTQEGESVPVEPFAAEPTAPETEPRTTAAPAGLINSTNSDERAQEVQSRINNAPQNPFDVLPVELVETLETPEEESDPVAASPQRIGGGGGGGTTTTQTNGGGGGTTATQATGSGGGTPATQTTGGGGTTASSGESGQPAVSLPPLPATVAQVAEPIPPIQGSSPIFVPPNDNALAQLSPAELGISEPEGEASPGGTPGSVPAGTSNGESIAQAEPGTAPGAEPGEKTEEAPLSLPPLESQPIAELPPLPTEIGPAIPPPPPVPPTISENVQVTGVVEVGGEVQVIVQLPGSSSGRYVRVGDVIAGGRVLVKRVDGIQSTNPIVILEEDGSEYPRFLGEPPTIAMEEDSGLG